MMNSRPPLLGVKVLDVASMMAGPYGATLLGDLGADVIKLEPPDGDEYRRVGPIRENESAPFVGVNRSKRSISVDLRTPGGREVLERLVRWADVLICNLRKNARQKLGLDFASLQKLNPKIVALSVSTFGETGPYAGRPGVDPSAQALSGLMAVTGEENSRPLKAGPPIGDGIASLMVTIGALSALWAREREGGQEVEVALIDGLIHVQAPLLGQHFLLDKQQPRMGNSSTWYGPFDSYLCADGKYIEIACYNDKFYWNLCDAMGRPDLKTDPRFVTSDLRLERRDELHAIIAGFFAEIEQRPAMDVLAEHDVIFGPVNNYAETFSDPQVQHNQMEQEVQHRTLGPLHVSGVPIRFSATPGRIELPPPVLGEHTLEILARLGFSEEEANGLVADRVVVAARVPSSKS